MKLYLDPLPKISKYTMPQSEIYYIYVPETIDRPEKRYLLNDTALEIISLYNGTNTYTDIINHLSRKYKEKPMSMEEKVNTFLSQLIQYGFNIKQQKDSTPHNYLIRQYENIYPSVVNLQLTEKCNLKCKHCYGEFDINGEKEMSLEEVEFILKSLEEIGAHTVEITGGEPSIYPHIAKVLKKIDEISIPTVMFLTNGVYLSDELLESMIAIKNKLFVQVSLHSFKEEYFDWFTNSKNNLKKVKNNIKKLIENDIKVRVTSIFTPNNINEVIEIGEWAFNNGVKLYAPSTAVSLGRATNIHEFDNLHINDMENIKQLQDSIEEIHKRYPNFILESPKPKINCGALITQSSIAVNGDLKLCNMDTGEYFNLKLGNVLNKSVKAVYDENIDFFNELRTLKAPNKDSEDCIDCSEKLFCNYCTLRGLIGSKRVEGQCNWYNKINPILKECFN